MPRDRALSASVIVLLAISLTACESLDLRRTRPEPVLPPVETYEAKVIADYLNTLATLLVAPPAQQAEAVARARQELTLEATPKARMIHALMLATPGHGASDPAAARRELLELLATPERLLPQERSLAAIMIANLEARSAADAESTRLRSESSRQEREKTNALNRRVQALVDENERLRKERDEANAKLDAIATLERSMSDRRPSNDGGKP